jgi:orotidine-5'-phosphate decarboxylase
MATKDSLCIALDGSDREWILATARSLSTSVGWFKIGLEAFVAHGPKLVEEVQNIGPKIFLDLKLHDIPATVRKAAANCARHGTAMLTVHAGGGRAMLEAAVEGVHEGAPENPPMVVAVTVLTSLDRPELVELGIEQAPDELVVAWAGIAKSAGLSGVVASAREAASVRRACGGDFIIVTPGIRGKTAAVDDQRRVLTPAQALNAGANVLVVGRPITRSPDPVQAALEILEEMASAGTQ